MKPGPPPKPTALKKLAGNPGRRKLNTQEPKPIATKPHCPDDLSDKAKKEWQRISVELHRLGLLTILDRNALALVCEAWADWLEAREKIDETGGKVLKSESSGGLYQNPWYQVANKAWDQYLKICAQFGLTPSDRSRLKIEETEKELSLAEQLFQMTKE